MEVRVGTAQGGRLSRGSRSMDSSTRKQEGMRGVRAEQALWGAPEAVLALCGPDGLQYRRSKAHPHNPVPTLLWDLLPLPAPLAAQETSRGLKDRKLQQEGQRET